MLGFLLRLQSDRNLRLQSRSRWEEAERAYRSYNRKLELFLVACSRRIGGLLADGRSRNLVDVAERYVDGLASFEEREAANAAAEAACFDHEPDNLAEVVAYSTAHLWEDDAADVAAHAAGCAARALGSDEADQAAELAAQADLLRDIFGPLPFREVPIDPAWLTPAVDGLASFIYEERAFDRLRDLAHIMEARGCTNPDILSHLRGPNVHVRGCHVLDLLLQKG
jgi:hypothetical protein